MGLMYEKVIRPILFTQDPERAHEIAALSLRYLSRVPTLCRLMERRNQHAGARPVRLFGLDFPNAVGLAAGMDKNAQFWRAAGALGFGHVEIGTVTAKSQAGNQRPRLFRYAKQEALINRMGFNNHGAEAIAARLKAAGAHRKRRIPLGINIGKSRVTSLEKAAEDYLESFHHLADYADYVAVNVSSPNTPELRQLQGHQYLPALLQALHDANQSRAKKLGQPPIPFLVKIAPDLSYREIDSILEDVLEIGYDGIIATNSTVARPGAFSGIKEAGGLTGRPLHADAVQIVNYIHRATEGKIPIVGVGGIFGPKDAARMFDAGASLVQIYTGMVFRGPFLPAEIARGLAPQFDDWI